MMQTASEFLQQLVSMDLGISFSDPNKRLFWGHILGSVLLILLVSGSQRWQQLRVLIDPKIWWHRSSRADMKIILVNSLLRSLLFASSLFSATALAAVVSLILTKICGGKPQLVWSEPLVIALYAATLFIADDFARFYLHRLQHRWRWLWVFHQTHHSALVLTPLTLLRTHPMEILEAQLRDVLVYGLISGLFFFGFDSSIKTWDVWGVRILAILFNLLGANLRHSQVWLHFGPLEKIFISPAAHQLHHSVEEIHYDKNFGVCLAIWDRLWGSHADPRLLQAPAAFGLRDSPLSAPTQNLWTLYWQPFADLWPSLYRPSRQALLSKEPL